MKWLVPSKQKLIAFLQGQIGDYSGKFLRKLLEANLCRINGKVERFGSAAVNSGDTVELAPSWKSLLAPKISHFETIFENDAFKIVNKPAGWVCEDKEALKAFGAKHYLVHRLDKETTGLLIIAKSAKARDEIMELFEKRAIAKRYVALIDGIPSEKEGMRKSLLAKRGAFQGQTIWGSAPKGLSALTHWKVLATGRKASLVAVEPETGRTHQIRVHMAEIGHPILVDRQYAKSFRCPLFIQRALLHAQRLQFSFHGEQIDVVAPLPKDLSEALLMVGIDMRELRQFFREEKHNDCRNESHEHKNAEEVEQASHLLHQTR